MKLVDKLLQYRSKPHMLFRTLIKCSLILDTLDKPGSGKPVRWHSEAREVCAYLYHQLIVMCVQSQQVSSLPKLLAADLPERGVPNTKVDADLDRQVQARFLNLLLEISTLGSSCWPLAEMKAQTILQGSQNIEAYLRLLEQLSKREHLAVAKEAGQLALTDGAGPLAMPLLRCCAARAWTNTAVLEIVVGTMSKHVLVEQLEKFYGKRRTSILDHGFMLRALPPRRLKMVDETLAGEDGEGGEADGQETGAAAGEEQPAEQQEGQVAAEEPPPPEVEPLDAMAQHADTQAMAHLQLLIAAPLLQELSELRFNWHDISRFKYFDLEQVMVPRLAVESADMSDTLDASFEATSLDALAKQSLNEGAAGEEGAAEAEQEPDDWQQKALENAENRQKAFKLLRRLLKPLCRAAIYANATNAQVLMQTVITMALNALLIVGPSPEECLPPGPKANPLDMDPDTYVGAEPPKEEAKDEAALEKEKAEAAAKAEAESKEKKKDKKKKAEEPDPKEAEQKQEEEEDPNDNDVWLNLAMISQLAVETLVVVSKRRLVGSENDFFLSLPAAQPGEKGEELEKEAEAKVVRSAKDACKLLAGADEEIQDRWYAQRQELDMTSTATFVAFSTLCLYHMRRWSTVVKLCQSFNDVTCSVFAPTFMPLAVGAQKELVALSQQALDTTNRYSTEVKESFDKAQKSLSRKLLRQLTLTGTLSKPQQRFESENTFYTQLRQRQGKLHDAWTALLKLLERAQALASKVSPLALEQLRKSRSLLSEYLRDLQLFQVSVQRGMLKGAEKIGRQRALKLAGAALVSSYRKAVELLRKRQMTDSVVLALHELGNLQWLEGDVAGAQASWSDAVDAAFSFVYAVQNWRECLQNAVVPPTTPERTEILLLTVAILAKLTQLTKPDHAISHLHAAVFASGIIEAVLTTSLPHPQHRVQLSPDVYTMRGIFFGLRESRMLLRPNSTHGGVDGTNFLGALQFFIQAMLTTGYTPARCVSLCALYTYIAGDVCRHQRLAIQGRLLMARSLIRCRSLASAWWTLYSVSKGHSYLSPMLTGGKLELSLAEASSFAGLPTFQVHEEPTSEANVKAVNTLAELELLPDGGVGEHNVLLFCFMQVEYLLCVCSYVKVTSKPADPEEKQRLAWLDKVATLLAKLWKELTGNDDDVETWAASVAQKEAEKHKTSGGANSTMLEASAALETPMMSPVRALTKEEADLSIELRLAKAKAHELRGDLAKAVVEVLYGMRFIRLLADGDTALASQSKQRIHPDVKVWMMLRRRMVHLLVAQGRYSAASAQISQGLEECRRARDELSHIELLAAKVKVDALTGIVSELRGSTRTGAVPAAERCLGIAQKHLPVGTPAVVHVRVMLSQLITEHPSLRTTMHGKTPSIMSKESLELQKNPPEEEDEALLVLKGQVVVSALAKDLQDGKEVEARAMEDYQDLLLQLAESAAQSAADLDASMEILGFDLWPGDVNSLTHISEKFDDEKVSPSILPLQQPEPRPRPQSDSRPPSNIYLEDMPLRLHLDLVLAKVRLDLGDLQVVQSILKEAEARMLRCVNLLPWLYVEFCRLKLRWRRLDMQAGCRSGFVAPPNAPNSDKFRDQRTYSLGLVPTTDSPLYRTFLQRMPVLSLTHDSEWAMRATTKPGILEQFLQEWLAVAKVAIMDGGHDYSQVMSLMHEALEEALRVAKMNTPTDGGAAQTFGQIYALFACLVATADVRKGLLTDLAAAEENKAAADQDAGSKKAAPKAAAKADKGGAGGGSGGQNIDVGSLPPRVVLDIQANLARQAHQGALGYSATALQEAQKNMLFTGVFKYMQALKRQCNAFGSIFHADRLICDQLHLALAQASDTYRRSKVLDASLLDAVAATPASEAVPNNDVIIYWMDPEVSIVRQPPTEVTAFMAFLCPVDGQEDCAVPMVARASIVPRKATRELQDNLAMDVEHLKPAKAVTEEHVASRLWRLASCLRGGEESSKDEALNAAMQALLSTLRSTAPEAKSNELDAVQTAALLKHVARLLDRQSPAMRISHLALNMFLRVVLGGPMHVL